MGWKKLLNNKFTYKDWSRSGLNSLLRRIDATGRADRQVGSGRPIFGENVNQSTSQR